jgi:hypothetical protein
MRLLAHTLERRPYGDHRADTITCLCMLFKVTTLFSLVLLLGYYSAVAWATGLDGASDLHGFDLASVHSSDATQVMLNNLAIYTTDCHQSTTT